MAELSLDELLSVHRQSLADVRAGVEGAELWLSTYSIQLTMHGKPGYQALWEAIDATEPHPMRIMLTGLLYDPGRRSQLRRHFHKLLGHDDPEYVALGVEGFMMIEDRKARRRVLDLRNHESPEVRAAVLSYIREVWPNETLKAMVDAFDDPDATVRQTAVTLLLTHTVVEASEPVREALRRQRRPHHVRDWVRDVLEGVENPSDDLANLAIEARDYLADDLGGKIRWKDVERAQKEWGEGMPVDPLIAMAMEHPDDQLRERLEALRDDPDETVRNLAAFALASEWERRFTKGLIPTPPDEPDG